MRMRSRWLVVALAAGLVAGAAGCTAPAPPDTAASIRGVVSGLSVQGAAVSFLVVGTGEYDQAAVSTDDETVILVREGDAYTETDTVADGDTVSVWFTGPVAESYPVQATAGTVVVE